MSVAAALWDAEQRLTRGGGGVVCGAAAVTKVGSGAAIEGVTVRPVCVNVSVTAIDDVGR